MIAWPTLRLTFRAFYPILELSREAPYDLN
jgi:hypothetical protein